MVERDGEGNAVIRPPGGKAPPSEREAFASQCYLNGVTDPAAVEELWAARQKRRADAQPKSKGKRERKGRK